MGALINCIAGLLFGIGLVIGGMTNPAKILNFLDITGAWDPSLALVLVSAVITVVIGYRLIPGRTPAGIGDVFYAPIERDVDQRLVFGSALFGTGWGLVGFCPGPAIATLSLGHTSTIVFVVAMLVGMYGGLWVPARPRSVARNIS